MIYKRDLKGIKKLKQACKDYRQSVIVVEKATNQIVRIIAGSMIPDIDMNQYMYYVTRQNDSEYDKWCVGV